MRGKSHHKKGRPPPVALRGASDRENRSMYPT